MEITGKEALEFARSNKSRSMAKWIEGFDGFAEVAHSPKFAIPKTAKFFTIGSCFARNVENWLRKSKLQLLSDVPAMPGAYYEIGGVDRPGYQNVYTPGSVLEALRLCGREDPYHSIIGEGDQYLDLLSSGLKPLPWDAAKSVRDGLLSAYRKMPEADVLIVTLGYNESWRYVPENAYINRAPSHVSLRRAIADFKFESMGHDSIVKCLRQAISLVHGLSPHCKVVLTVSPVPLGGTFSPESILIANQRSKAALLSAAWEVVADYEYVDYFPSYEIVTNSERAKVFELDGVHVKQEIVGRVMNSFFASYFSDLT